MIQLIVLTISSEEEHCDTILKAMAEIAEKCPQFLRSRTEDLIRLCLEAFKGVNIMDTRKHLCIEMIISLAENAPQTIRKRGAPYLGQLGNLHILDLTIIFAIFFSFKIIFIQTMFFSLIIIQFHTYY